MRTLFPTDPVQVDDKNEEGAGDCLLFTRKKLEEAVLSPESEGIPAEIYKLVFHHRTNLLRIYSLSEGRYFDLFLKGVKACANEWKCSKSS